MKTKPVKAVYGYAPVQDGRILFGMIQSNTQSVISNMTNYPWNVPRADFTVRKVKISLVKQRGKVKK